MKHPLFATALLAATSLHANAQTSVQVYGVMDAAVAIKDTGAPGEGHRTTVQSGSQSSSRLGFRATEELSNGVKALFNIEGGVALDTGAADSALWGRRAVVGLQGSFGTLTLGREYSPLAAVAAASDILGQGMYGSNLAAFGSNRLTRRLSNSINYKSQAFSNLTVNAAYATGEKSVDPSGDLLGMSVEYRNGGLYLGAGVHSIERLASGDDREYGVGVGYTMGQFEIKGNYLKADPESALAYTNANLGLAWSTGANKLFFNVQQQKLANGARGNTLSLAYTYALSKRTNIYSTYARLTNNARAAFGINASSTNVTPPASALGADPSVFTVGMRHSF